ncbi:hypothetical protein [Dapis sp. BLCC M172]|uniref:hypothetical protein n=1 Tax=Dapis sp. BLCC M172 TaxID=2975281 RepID=UPI003CF0245A
MNFLKTNTQESNLRNLFTSCFCGLSSAVLASSFALFAPNAAVAPQLRLIDSDSDGKYEKVENLLVENSLYDVTIENGTLGSVYDDGFGGLSFDFSNLVDAEAAFVALVESVDDFAFESSSGPPPTQFSDVLYIYTNAGVDQRREQSGYYWGDNYGLGGAFWNVDDRQHQYIARFTPSSSGNPISPASTPEPNLILGFITLSGLMLGSKRKTNA